MTAFVASDMVAVSSRYKRCSAAPVGISVAFRRRSELQVNFWRISTMKAVVVLLAYLVAAASCANQGASSKDLATSSSVYYGYGSYGAPYGYSPYGGYAGGAVYSSPIYNGLGYGGYARLGYGGLGYGGGGYYGGYGLGSGLGSGYGALNSLGGYGYGLGYGKLGYGGLGYGGFY